MEDKVEKLALAIEERMYDIAYNAVSEEQESEKKSKAGLREAIREILSDIK